MIGSWAIILGEDSGGQIRIYFFMGVDPILSNISTSDYPLKNHHNNIMQ